jgi:hypothetical protein
MPKKLLKLLDQRRRSAPHAVEDSTRHLVTGADQHIDLVRRAMWRQAIVAVLLAGAIWGLSAWNDLSAHLGKGTTPSPTIRAEPTSGSNILAAYALLGALLFALQVSVRSLNNETDVAKQLDPAELGRRQMVGYLAITAGIAAFGLAILCLYWYGDFGGRLDLFRVIGPVGASVVLAAIAAETFVVTEAPRDSQLRLELEAQTLRKAEEAYDRLPHVTEPLHAVHVTARVVVLVLVVSSASWAAWALVIRDARPWLMVAAAFFALIGTLWVCWTTVTASTSLARRATLEAVGIITMSVLILVLYAGESWLAFSRAMRVGSEPAVYRLALASLVLYLGPAVLAPLLSLRGFDGSRPGILLVLASLRLRRRVEVIKNAAARENSEARLSPAERKRQRRARAALWLSPLPLVPQLLLRVSDVDRLPSENRRVRRTAAILSYGFIGTYVLAGVYGAIVWAK